jgi:hypothetical protein
MTTPTTIAPADQVTLENIRAAAETDASMCFTLEQLAYLERITGHLYDGPDEPTQTPSLPLPPKLGPLQQLSFEDVELPLQIYVLASQTYVPIEEVTDMRVTADHRGKAVLTGKWVDKAKDNKITNIRRYIKRRKDDASPGDNATAVALVDLSGNGGQGVQVEVIDSGKVKKRKAPKKEKSDEPKAKKPRAKKSSSDPAIDKPVKKRASKKQKLEEGEIAQ